MRTGRASGLALAAALWLAGCAQPGPPRTQRPLADVSTLGVQAAASPAWPAEAWWQAFGDGALTALIERALAGQPDVLQAQARAQQAAAATGQAEAAQAPRVDLSDQLDRQRFTERGLVPPAFAGAARWTHDLRLGASWELDLFGRQRAALEAAIGRQRAAEADAQAARVLLAAQVASRWFALAHRLEQQRLAALELTRRERLLDLVRQRVDAGLDDAATLHQAESGLAEARAEQPVRAAAVALERHALAELSAQPAAALQSAAPTLATLPPRPWPTRLGADLLGRRADLVAQRWRVEAAWRDVDVARGRFYPDINLVAFVGLSSLGLDQLLDLGARTWGAGPALRLPVFDGGRLRAQLAQRSAEADAAVDGWNATLLRALREVADEASSLHALQHEQAARQQALAAAEAGLRLARQRRQAGLASQLTVLAAEAGVITRQLAAADLKARRLAGEVALIRALGGGYDGAPPNLPRQPS